MRINLASKLVFGFVLLGAVPLVLYGILSFAQFERTIQAEELAKLQALTYKQVQRTDQIVLDLHQEIGTLAKTPTVFETLRVLEGVRDEFGSGSAQYEEAQRSLRKLAEHYVEELEFHDFFLMNTSGAVIFSVSRQEELESSLLTGTYQDSALAAVFRRALETRDTVMSPFSFRSQTTNEPGLFVAAPIMEEGSIVGVVALQANPLATTHFNESFTGMGETGETILAVLADNAAVIVVPLRHSDVTAFTMRVPLGSEESSALQDAVQGKTGNGLTDDYRDEPVLGSWTYLPELGLGLLTKIDVAEAYRPMHELRLRSLWLALAAVFLLSGAGLIFSRTLSKPIKILQNAASKMAEGDLEQTIELKRSDEIGQLATRFNEMAARLRQGRQLAAEQDWLKTGISQVNSAMLGGPDLGQLSSKVVSTVSKYLDAKIAAFYLMDQESSQLSLTGSYAFNRRKNLSSRFELGEGLVGQAALEGQQILVRNVPEDYIRVTSALGEQVPRFICVTPFQYEGQVRGVIEIGTLDEMTELQMKYLSQAMPAIALAVEAARGRTELARSLEAAQQMTEELQVQQEELRVANEELEEKSQLLEDSGSQLRIQQEELQVMNEELEEKNELLEHEKVRVEAARNELADKAQSLTLANKYKSEFLANMSHELRTPLNSLLLLSQGLTKNPEGNLTDEQMESARIIFSSGNDLLNLINEILDLSRIEAGRVDLEYETVSLDEAADSVRDLFSSLAKEKDLEFTVSLGADCPREVVTDRQRLLQVIRNLAGNAIKFTHEGSVAITFDRVPESVRLADGNLAAKDCFMVRVTDTGIGISEAQSRIIFEAFQQADGSTARKYGGTGLGLAISKELIHILGGEIALESSLGNGSTFTVYLPRSYGPQAASPKKAEERVKPAGKSAAVTRRETEQLAAESPVDDDRDVLQSGDRVMLIIEDNPDFSKILRDMCHRKGFKCLVAGTGKAGLALAQDKEPHGVLLDIGLPDMDGWSVLDALKQNLRTRHIPVHVVSAEPPSNRAQRAGAVGHAVKPVSPEDLEETIGKLERFSGGGKQQVLVVEDDAPLRRATVDLIGTRDVIVQEASNGEEALAALRSEDFACVVLDLKLPDINGDELLTKLEQEGIPVPPVIVHTARDISYEDEMMLRAHEGTIVMKDVRSQERLLDEVSLFLHRVVSKMPEKERKIIRELHDSDSSLQGKQVLVVDDDMRTAFAVSRLLSSHGASPVKAEDGARALQVLEENPDIDLVLMDIMMPTMDGYEATKKIRAQEKFGALPIIALTAKAMPEDRDKCISAGVNDYLTKPVDEDRLISLLRVWLYR